MPAKDIYHDAVVHALVKDAWIITHDPLTVAVGRRDLLIDLGAERMLAAERNGERIAVEIKSFVKLSLVQDLKEALGQFVLYEDALARSTNQSDRTLYLALREETYDELFTEPIGEMLLDNRRLRLIVFDEVAEVIVKWIK
jgi:hypothetical protein